MARSVTRVFVVDDCEPWRKFYSKVLGKQPHLQVIGYASDGSEAVQRAAELQPDLILMDIALPTLNGIDAVRKIRELAPTCKILFVSQNRCLDVVEKALSAGAEGYLIKEDAGCNLLAAIKLVLRDKRFLSASLADHFLVATALSGSQIVLSWAVTLISGIH
jgi:DNA-binding NarL/FixJ family response regulator